MRFRLHADQLHVHACAQHPQGCEYFRDHTLAWMIGSREEARDQLMAYRHSIVVRIAALSTLLVSIDSMLTRLKDLALIPAK
jgi:hypothetical protein